MDPCPKSPVKIMMNVGTPEQAFAFSRLPEPGVGPGPAGIHHQPSDRHPPEGPAGVAELDEPLRGRDQ